MIVKLLTEYHLEFLSLKGGCRGLSESTHVKISNCWKSHAVAHLIVIFHTLMNNITTYWSDFNDDKVSQLKKITCTKITMDDVYQNKLQQLSRSHFFVQVLLAR